MSMRVATVTAHNHGINSILDKQAALTKTELQLATGRRILRPSDDPAASAMILNLKQSIGKSEQYIRNADSALTSLSFAESATEGVMNSLQRARELTVQALNGTNSAENRKSLSLEIRQIRDSVFNIANSRDTNGEYIFAGSKTDSPPFTVPTGTDGKTGDVSYNGNSRNKHIEIGVGQRMSVRDTGREVFGPESFMVGTTASGKDINIKTTAASGSTEQTITMSAGMTIDNVVDAINATSGDSKVQASNDNGKLRITTTDGAEAVLTDSGTAGGLQSIGIMGEGTTKTYTTKPDIFKALDSLADQMESGTMTSDTLLSDLDAGMDLMVRTEAKIGSRINMIDRHKEVSESFIVKMKETKSEVNDLDYAEAIARFNIDKVAMQAAQQAYIKLQGMSLFNYMN